MGQVGHFGTSRFSLVLVQVTARAAIGILAQQKTSPRPTVRVLTHDVADFETLAHAYYSFSHCMLNQFFVTESVMLCYTGLSGCSTGLIPMADILNQYRSSPSVCSTYVDVCPSVR